MEKTPNKINSENSNAEKSDNGWDEVNKLAEQVNKYREAVSNARFNELLKERDERLAWKDSENSGPSTGASEENRLDALLESAPEVMPDKPVEFEPDAFEPIPEEDVEMLLDNEKDNEDEPKPEKEPISEEETEAFLDDYYNSLPPAEELEKAKKHQEIEMAQRKRQAIEKHEQETKEAEKAIFKPLMIINVSKEADRQAAKQENLVPADKEFTENIEWAVRKYAEYTHRYNLNNRKSNIDEQFKRDMKKIVKRAIEEGQVSPDIENTDYLDNYLSVAKEAANRFVDAEKDDKDGKESEKTLDNIMKDFQVYDIKDTKESAPTNEVTLESPVDIAQEASPSPEAGNFDKWNEQISKEINSTKDLIGHEGVALIYNPAHLSRESSMEYNKWWSGLSRNGRKAVFDIVDKIESYDYRHDITWGSSFLAWFYARANRTSESEAA